MTLEASAFESAHAVNVLDVGRLPLRQLDDQIVAQDAPRRHVPPLGLLVTPAPELADNRQAPRWQAGNARDAAPVFDRFSPLDVLLKRGHFFIEPRSATELVEPLFQNFADAIQMHDVL